MHDIFLRDEASQLVILRDVAISTIDLDRATCGLDFPRK